MAGRVGLVLRGILDVEVAAAGALLRSSGLSGPWKAAAGFAFHRYRSVAVAAQVAHSYHHQDVPQLAQQPYDYCVV